MEESLAAVGCHPPTQVSKYSDVARLHAIYSEVEAHPAWKDLMARMHKMRTDIASELLAGTLDKFGNSRDAEKRAVLTSLDRIATFSRSVHTQFEELEKQRKKQEDRLEHKTGIHDRDVLSNRAAETPGTKAQW